MSHWKVVTTLPRLHKPQAIWFKDDVGLIFGEYRSLDQLLQSNHVARKASMEAFILRSTGSFEQWDKVYSGKGQMMAVSHAGKNTFYGIGREHLQSGDTKSFLLKSIDLGNSWVECPPLPQATIGMGFYSEREGYAWSTSSLFHTRDGAQTWTDAGIALGSQQRRLDPVVDAKGLVWIYMGDSLTCLNLRNESSSDALPSDFDLRLMALGEDNNIWLAGVAVAAERQKRRIRIIKKRQQEEGFDVVVELPYFVPEAFHVGKSTVALIGADVEETPPIYYVMFSNDLGATWQKETPAVAHAFGPACFEGDQIIWACTSADRIQRRSP